MGLHAALEVKEFDTYGFSCRGLFVKTSSSSDSSSTAVIRKGEAVWWLDPAKDAPLRTYTKRDILTAPTTMSSSAAVYSDCVRADTSVNDWSAVAVKDTDSLAYSFLTEIHTPPNTPSAAASVCDAPSTVETFYTASSTLRSIENHSAHDTFALSSPSSSFHEADHSGTATNIVSKLPSPRPSTATIDINGNSTATINPREMLVTYSYMADDDVYLSTPYPDEDVSYYYNHSCTPNTAYVGDDLIVALRDIYPGEQVVYDYAFTETQDSLHYGMQCRCGTVACRGTLDFLQYKDPLFIAEHYQHCTSYIQRKMSENGWLHDHVVRRRIWSPPSSRNGSENVILGGIEGVNHVVASAANDSHGLFAFEPIPEATTIIVFAGKVVSGKYVESLSPREQEMSLQIDTDLWQIPNSYGQGGEFRFETGDYINHSCNPNCGMLDGARVVTMRHIGAGEALTIDYAMVNTGAKNLAGEIFVCNCGGSRGDDAFSVDKANDGNVPVHPCRGMISALDYQKVGGRFLSFLAPFVRTAFLEHCKEENPSLPSLALRVTAASPTKSQSSQDEGSSSTSGADPGSPSVKSVSSAQTGSWQSVLKGVSKPSRTMSTKKVSFAFVGLEDEMRSIVESSLGNGTTSPSSTLSSESEQASDTTKNSSRASLTSPPRYGELVEL